MPDIHSAVRSNDSLARRSSRQLLQQQQRTRLHLLGSTEASVQTRQEPRRELGRIALSRRRESTLAGRENVLQQLLRRHLSEYDQ